LPADLPTFHHHVYPVVADVRQDTDRQSAGRSNHFHVQTSGYRSNVDTSGHFHVAEDLDNSKNRSDEAKHRRYTGNNPQYVDVLFQLGDFKLTRVFNSALYILYRAAHPRQALL